MKKLFTLLMMLPMLILGEACSRDDPIKIAIEVAGNYEGYT